MTVIPAAETTSTDTLNITAAYFLFIFLLGIFSYLCGPEFPILAKNTSSWLD